MSRVTLGYFRATHTPTQQKPAPALRVGVFLGLGKGISNQTGQKTQEGRDNGSMHGCQCCTGAATLQGPSILLAMLNVNGVAFWEFWASASAPFSRRTVELSTCLPPDVRCNGVAFSMFRAFTRSHLCLIQEAPEQHPPFCTSMCWI